MRGEAALRLGVAFHVVAHVDEISIARLQTLGKGAGFFDGFVAVVRLVAQGTEHEDARTASIGHGLGRKGGDVRDIHQSANAETEYGQFAVHHGQGQHLRARNAAGLQGVQRVEFEVGDAGIFVFHKTVREAAAHIVGTIFISIYLHGIGPAEGAQVVDAAHVVVVLVREQHGIGAHGTGQAQHLLAEVGAAVDEDSAALGGFYQCRGAQPLVARVGAGAYGAVAAYDGNAATCAAA